MARAANRRISTPVVAVSLLLATTAIVPPAHAQTADQTWWDRFIAMIRGSGDAGPPPAIDQPAAGQGLKLFDDDAIVGFTQPRVEIAENAGKVRVTVKRRANLASSVTVRVETEANGAARAGTDFTFLASEVVFQRNETEKYVDIDIIDNATYQGNRTFDVILKPVGPGRVDPARMTVEIREDDPAPKGPRRGVLAGEPPELALGGLETGQTAEKQLVLRNTGQRGLVIGKPDITGGGGAVSVLASTCSTELQAGASCAATIGFAPSRIGPVKASFVMQWREMPLADDQAGTDPLRSGIFNLVMGGLGIEPPPVYDPMQDLIRAAKQQRVVAEPGGRSYVDPEPATPAPPSWKVTDEDFRKVGIGRNYATLPVRRERIITTTRYIPCVLETGIISELAGSVICVVESNVYGGDGRFILIPARTRVEGEYQPLGKNGETRLNIIWKRFERPDGSTFYTKDGFQAHDISGNVGVPGEVDNRWFEKYGSALFVTVLSAAAGFAVPERNTASSQQGAIFADRANSAQRNISEGMLNVARQQLEENLDLRPVTRIRQGERLIIKPTLDLWFPIPEALVATTERPAQQAAAQPAPVSAGAGQQSQAQRLPPTQGRQSR